MQIENAKCRVSTQVLLLKRFNFMQEHKIEGVDLEATLPGIIYLHHIYNIL